MYQAINFDYASTASKTEMHQHQTQKFSFYVTEKKSVSIRKTDQLIREIILTYREDHKIHKNPRHGKSSQFIMLLLVVQTVTLHFKRINIYRIVTTIKVSSE